MFFLVFKDEMSFHKIREDLSFYKKEKEKVGKKS